MLTHFLSMGHLICRKPLSFCENKLITARLLLRILYSISTAGVFLFIWTSTAHPVEGMDEFTQEYQTCYQDCTKERGVSFPCISYCAWQACEKTQKVEMGPLSTSRTGDFQLEGHTGMDQTYVVRIHSDNPCVNSHPSCTPNCDVAVRDLKKYAEGMKGELNRDFDLCQFAEIKAHYKKMTDVCTMDKRLCQQIEIKGFYEKYYRDASKYEPILNEAKARLEGQLSSAKQAYNRCQLYDIKYSQDEEYILRKCSPELLKDVMRTNQLVKDRYERFEKAQTQARACLDTATRGLQNCAPEQIECGDIREILGICEPHLIGDIDGTNRESNSLEKAIAESQQIIEKGEQALDMCEGLARARADLKKVAENPSLVRYNCRVVSKAQGLISRINDVLNEFAKAKTEIEKLLAQAETNLKYCEWEVLGERVAQARLYLGDNACWKEFPEYSRLMVRIDDMEKRANSRAGEVRWHWAKIEIQLAKVRRYVAAGQGADRCEEVFQRDMEEGLGPLEQAVRSAREYGYGDCMLELMDNAQNIISQANALRIQCKGANCGLWPGSVAVWDQNNRLSCDCPKEKGLAWNKDRTACIDYRQATVETADCSGWPGTEPRWNDRTNRVDCFCVQGKSWNRDHTACVDERQAAVEKADCSQWPGTEPRWNDRTNRVDCFCVQGKSWNRDHTACIDERQAAVEKADCSQWPGTEPRWNDRTNRVDCFCVQGMAWNRDHTACIDERQAAFEKADCSRWPGSIARWNNQTSRVECFCPDGMAKHRDNTKCISCADYENRFAAAYNANQINAARGFLEEAVNCPWYGKAADALRKRGQYLAEQNEKERKCNELYNRFLNALKSKQFDQARGILTQAKDCGFQRQGYNDLCNQIRAALTEAKGRKDIRQFGLFLPQAKGCTFYEQANADLRQMELDEHCNKIGTALNEAKRLKDINRFRTLLTQAQKCGFYQQALADLRKMEGDQVQAKTKPAPPQPPSGHPSDPQYRQKCVGPEYYGWDEQRKQWILSTGLGYGSTNERVLSWSNPPCPQKGRQKIGEKSYVEYRRYWDNCAQKYYCAEVEERYK